MPTPPVTDVELDRAASLTVTYDDGVRAVFPLAELRRGCPCATCRGRRERGLDVDVDDSLTALDAELHGNWGISIRWSDGHATGIYGWDLLRRWWDAAAN